MDQYQRLDPRWDFRSNDSDLDSSSNDSRMNPIAVPKHKKQKLVPCNDSQDNEESSQRPSKEAKTRNRPPKLEAKAKKSNTGFNDYDSAAAFCSLQTHIGCLVEEIKVAQQSLFSWMGEEMGKLTAEEAPPKSTRRRKSGLQERKQQQRSETGQKLHVKVRNQNSGRGKKKINDANTGVVAQEQASPAEALGSLASTSTATTTSVATNCPSAEKGVAKSSDMAFGFFASTSSALAATPLTTTSVTATRALHEKDRVDVQSHMPMFTSNQSHMASSSNYQSSPTITPSTTANIKPLAEDPQKTKSMRAPVSTTRIDLSTHQAYYGGLLQAERFLAQKGTGNASGFEQLKCIPTGRNESGVPAQFFRGLSGGFGILNSNQLGFDHLTQSNGVSNVRMNGAGMTFFGGE
ncbi:hypothetical protein Droror1_Dr00005391 [Drosera rotundifolia]